MSPASDHPPRRRRARRPVAQSSAGGARDIIEAFGRYFDRVEYDSVGNLVATCSRCRVVDVIAWPDDERYVLERLRHAHARHNHAIVPGRGGDR